MLTEVKLQIHENSVVGDPPYLKIFLKSKYYRHENRVKKRTLVYVLKIWKVDDSKKDVEPID